MERKFKIWRQNPDQAEFITYSVSLEKGMVVLDALHKIQVEHANDLAVRWNCKAGKCGSCSMEINGKPKLACMTRLSEYADDELITIQPLKTFPIIKDLVTDVSWNYKQNKMISPFNPGKNKNGKASGKKRGKELAQTGDPERYLVFRLFLTFFFGPPNLRVSFEKMPTFMDLF